MDWTQIILGLLGTTTIGGTVTAFIYRRQNKQLKNNEVKKDNVATQIDQINLAEIFTQKSADMFKRMEELQEQTYKATLNNGKDNENILRKVDEIAAEQRNIVAYLNGDYQDFLKRNMDNA